MSISVEPVKDLVLVQMIPLPEKTGSIHRVNSQRYEYTRDCTVLKIGPDVKDVRPGDVVSLPALVGQKVGNDDTRIVPESSILYIKQEAA